MNSKTNIILPKARAERDSYVRKMFIFVLPEYADGILFPLQQRKILAALAADAIDGEF